MRPALFLLAIALPLSAAGPRTVAITIDDLPVAQSGSAACEPDTLLSITRRLLRPVREQNIPVAGFVVGDNCADLKAEQRLAVLREWLAAKAVLANHTFSHRSLHRTPIEEYEQDILREDRELRALTGAPVRWFRSPALHTGNTPELKARLERFLSRHGYRQAPVTIDNSEWIFANVYADALDRGDHDLARRVRSEYVPYLESVTGFFENLSVAVVGREIPQILLLHANRLNADLLPEILAMFRRRGYRFVSLDQAMSDAAYRSADTYAGERGISSLRRWAVTKGMPDRAEPGEPKWLLDAFAATRERAAGNQPGIPPR